MEDVWLSARQTPGYSLKRRIRSTLLRYFGRALQKSQDLRFVTINGHRFKRLILGDSYMAEIIAETLSRFDASDLFPPVVTIFENEVWVDFIDGPQLDQIDETTVGQLVDFYCTVYSRRPREVDTDQTPFANRLRQDLRFLNQVAVLSDSTYDELSEVASEIMPPKVWIGFDYVDPVLKNFVVRKDGKGLCAIDVESLRDQQLIGTGVAKACVHWLQPHRAAFFEQMASREVPDFLPYFAFVEMCFLARWTKTKFLTKKWKFVDPALFDRFFTANTKGH